MFYDQGGRGGPLPMPQQRPKPTYQQPWTPTGFKDALAARANAGRQSMGMTQPFEFQSYQQQQPMGMTSMPQQQQPAYGARPMYGAAGGQMGGAMGGMGSMGRRRRPLYARDVNGRTAGMWGYQQQPQYDRPPMQLY